jgi:hypothetical protein
MVVKCHCGTLIFRVVSKFESFVRWFAWTGYLHTCVVVEERYTLKFLLLHSL